MNIDPGLAFRSLRNLDEDDYEIVIRVRRRDIESAIEVEREAMKPKLVSEEVPSSWRERLWVAHPDTRLTINEAVEALGRSKTWICRHMKDSDLPVSAPEQRLDLHRWRPSHLAQTARGRRPAGRRQLMSVSKQPEWQTGRR